VSAAPVLLEHVGERGSHTMEHYRARGGWETAKRVLTTMKPVEVLEVVKASGLRGRGGAGFPTGQKWSFVPKDPGPKYLVCNADESEPGTFKDRALLEGDPHLLLEGCLISAYAAGLQTCYIYIRGEFVTQAVTLERAIQEAYAGGFFGRDILGSGFSLDVTVHRGAGAYICGEETGLLSSLEGGRGYPKIKPPFPAVKGLFGRPTVVNNVETLATVPLILAKGVAWFRGMGTEKSPGPKIFCVSGHVKRPGLYELPLGYPLMRLLYEDCGGPWRDRPIKAVIPGGSSAPVLDASELEVKLDFESLAAAGSMLGSGGVIVLDEGTCMVDALWNVLRFYHHESCGQCTPCREGTGWIERILGRIEHGRGRMEDLKTVEEASQNMMGKTICVLADAAALPALSFLKKFRAEFIRHLEEQGCPMRREGEPAGRSPQLT